jgi:hypothetical protein
LTLSDNQNRHSEKLLANLTTQVDHHFATGRRFQTLIAAAPSHPDCRATTDQEGSTIDSYQPATKAPGSMRASAPTYAVLGHVAGVIGSIGRRSGPQRSSVIWTLAGAATAPEDGVVAAR